jgi:hypothetical protein
MAHKITFVKGALETVVWDAENKRSLAEFVGGKFTTSDERTIKILRGLGYRSINDFPEGPPEGGFAPKKSDAADINTGDPNVSVKAARTETQALLEHTAKERSKAAGQEEEDDADVPKPKKRTVGRKVPRKVRVKKSK